MTKHHQGEQHFRAKLTDDEVELMRQLYESSPLGYERIASKFNCGASTVRDIVQYRTRCYPA